MKYCIFFSCILFSTIGFSQNFIQQHYGDTLSNNGKYFLQAEDSGFYILSYDYDVFSNQKQWRILRTNSLGDSLGFVSLPFISRSGSVCTNSIDEFVIATVFDTLVGQTQFIDTIFVNTVDTAGNQLLTWKYGDTLSLSNVKILKTSEGGYLVCGGVWNFPILSDIIMIKIDSLGVIQWKTFILPYTQGAGEEVIDLIETSDHFFVLEIQQSSGSNWAGNKYMIKADPSGNVIWTTLLTYGKAFGIGQQMLDVDSGILYLDNINYSMNSAVASRISLVDTGGILKWSKLFFPLSNYSGMIKSPDNEIYLRGRIQPQLTQWDIIITKLNASLDSVTTISGGFISSDENLNYFGVLPDSGLACIGYTKSGITAQSYDLFFMLTDKLSKALIIDEYQNQTDILIYPNPVHSEFLIRSWKKPIQGYEILNIFGQIVKKGSDRNLLDNNSEFLIDFSNQPFGIYFVRLHDDNFEWTGKFIKE